jgi:hypothetical protein
MWMVVVAGILMNVLRPEGSSSSARWNIGGGGGGTNRARKTRAPPASPCWPPSISVLLIGVGVLFLLFHHLLGTRAAWVAAADLCSFL